MNIETDLGLAGGTDFRLPEETDRAAWQRQLIVGVPDHRLRDYVLGYVGCPPGTRLPAIQRVLPSCGMPLLLEFEPAPGKVHTPSGVVRIPTLPVVGPHDHAVLIEPEPTHQVIIALTPLGAYAVLGIALRELANTYTTMVEILGDRVFVLIERLVHIPTWSARFALLDRTLADWLSEGRRPAAAIVRAWHLLRDSKGRSRIGAVAEELGISRRYLEKRFSEQIGLSPKTAARIMRFTNATRLFAAVPGHDLGWIAWQCGYSDQAHFHREFKALAGCTPKRFAAERQYSVLGRA